LAVHGEDPDEESKTPRGDKGTSPGERGNETKAKANPAPTLECAPQPIFRFGPEMSQNLGPYWPGSVPDSSVPKSQFRVSDRPVGRIFRAHPPTTLRPADTAAGEGWSVGRVLGYEEGGISYFG